MLEIISKTNFDFIGKRYSLFSVSGALIAISIISLVMKGGPKWGLDFTGGNLVEVRFSSPVSSEEVRASLAGAGMDRSEIQSVPAQNAYIIRTPLEAQSRDMAQSTMTATTSAADTGKKIKDALSASFPSNSVNLLRMEYVGPAVGAHLKKQAMWAVIFSFLGIILYVAFRFHSGVWGASGILALAHDVFVTVGLLSVLDKEVTITVVAALLTIAGYSINDTIVIFDRMREKMRFLRTEPLSDIINASLNETLSRTIITSLTVLLVVLALFFFGGAVIHDFALCMVWGVLVGCYSTLAIAAPMVFEWERIHTRKK